MTDALEFDFDERFAYFKRHLQKIKELPFLTYSDMMNVNEYGLYFAFKGKELIYIGKTNRQGKTRIREMGSDFRSHTLNRKLLTEELNLSVDIGGKRLTINNKSKKKLIDEGILTNEQFFQLQQSVQTLVRQQLKFKFYNFQETNLTGMENFLIGFLHPTYNN